MSEETAPTPSAGSSPASDGGAAADAAPASTPGRGKWGSRAGFILAAAGSAVGLGNIWKFPYITGENGGGLFVLIYLVCIALVGLPIMVAEIMIGRSARKQPVVAFQVLEGGKTPWSAIGSHLTVPSGSFTRMCSEPIPPTSRTVPVRTSGSTISPAPGGRRSASLITCVTVSAGAQVSTR